MSDIEQKVQGAGKGVILAQGPDLAGNWTIAVLSFVIPIVFFSPYLFGSNPQYLFTGDMYNLYFPQFMEGYYRFKNGGELGIDFLTNNGASAYYLRPNIPAYYPPYHLVYAIFDLESVKEFARAFILLFFLHSAAAFYFTIKLCRRFFDLELVYGVLLATGYIFAVAKWITILPFFHVAALFPVVVYAALSTARGLKVWEWGIYSFPFLLLFLSGYIPLAVHAAAFAILFALLYQWQFDTHAGVGAVGRVFKTAVPAALAGVVVLPLYLAIIRYHKLVPGVPDMVWYAAHDMSYTTTDLLSILTRGFLPSTPGEIPHVVLGLLPFAILLFAFLNRNRLEVSDNLMVMVQASLLVFAFHVLMVAGTATGLPDLFYYLVPGVGKMHLYGRYLLVTSFFLYLAVVLLLKSLANNLTDIPKVNLVASLIVVAVGFYVYGQVGEPKYVNNRVLVLEILLVSLVFLLGFARDNRIFLGGAIFVMLLVHAGNFNAPIQNFRPGAPAPYQNTVVYSKERQALLADYFKRHSEKTLIKYVDLTSSIEKLNGIMLNYPWVSQGHVVISNYMGYELHNSVDREYLDRFPWFGKIDVSWLRRTGVDYVVYDAAAWEKHAKDFESWLDRSVPELDIWYGYRVAKLKDISTLKSEDAPRNGTVFDNGVYRVECNDGKDLMPTFSTDYSSFAALEMECGEIAKLSYQLFPNKNMGLYLDGEKVEPEFKDGVIEMAIPSGKHLISYQYRNLLHQLFVPVFWTYMLFLGGIILWRGISIAHSYYLKR